MGVSKQKGAALGTDYPPHLFPPSLPLDLSPSLGLSRAAGDGGAPYNQQSFSPEAQRWGLGSSLLRPREWASHTRSPNALSW